METKTLPFPHFPLFRFHFRLSLIFIFPRASRGGPAFRFEAVKAGACCGVVPHDTFVSCAKFWDTWVKVPGSIPTGGNLSQMCECVDALSGQSADDPGGPVLNSNRG